MIGADKELPTENILYAVWEPMYYLTLENHSTDFDINFHLQFSDMTGDDPTVYVIYTNVVTNLYDREVFSEHSDTRVKATRRLDSNNKPIPGDFDVTIYKAASADDYTKIKLVIPQGAQASYSVTGTIDGRKDGL
ncbi:MAG: hypothetical protein IJH07_10645 [Ruminococcus sp.]|nr:hypothetical protein [Ruminococcus sp.]